MAAALIVIVVLLMVILLLIVVGLGRWVILRGSGGSRTWFALVLILFPYPVGWALGGLGLGLTGDATVFVFTPVVGVVGTLGTGWRRRRIRRASFWQATAFAIPPEEKPFSLRLKFYEEGDTPEISVLALGGQDEGDEGDGCENMLEKHG